MKCILIGTMLWSLATGVLVYGGYAEESPFNYISLKACGVDRFLEEHPTWDGRGVVVFVLDNGADVDVPGLQTTSEGKPKFIDARDFTGEGEIELSLVEMSAEGSVQTESGDLKLTGLNRLILEADQNQYYLGVLEEKRFKNSEFAGLAGSTDINDNGRENDVFGVLAFPVEREDRWVVLVDTDQDGEIDDEQAMGEFKDRTGDKLYFHRRLPDQQKKPFTLVVHFLPDEKKVQFHYADGAHSTHVSGIAAGYRIDGQDGYNGVAPGAQLVSLKIGDCTLAGGATVRESMKKAYEFARDYHKEHEVPVVLNMSYGIGSELEGSTDIDRFVDDLLLNHPGMILCTSAGNEGPGISTVGTPAASFMALSVGAVLAEDVARNVYNSELGGHRVLHFSSRGGETDKPDFVAPGACLSTVPRWRAGARMWGTSMASPYAAGVTALLVSAAMQEYPGVEINSTMIRRALQNSAKPLEFCNDLDQGRGMIDLPAAWAMLETYLKQAKNSNDPVLAYDIETFCPEGADGKARAAYWRSTYRPGAEEKQEFTVKALFKPDTPAMTIDEFFRKYTLASDAPFINLIPESLPLRKDGGATVSLTYDPDVLKAPGIYTGRVTAYEGAAEPVNRVFDLLNTVIVPHTFGPENGYALAVTPRTIEPLEVHHYYLAVPAGASAMRIRAEIPENRFALARIELFDPEGRSHTFLPGLDSVNGEQDAELLVHGDDLEPGIWELTVFADYRGGHPSHYQATVVFFGVEVLDNPALELDYAPGKTPTGSLKVMNRFNKAVWATATGKMWGYSRTRRVEIKDQETWRYDFSVDAGIKGVRFKLTMSPEDYGLFTDFAINIKDGSGNTLAKEGLSYRSAEIDFLNPGDAGTYTFEIVAGYTHGEKTPFSFELKEEFILEDSIALSVSTPGADRFIPLIPD
ncbi:MAG: S8 family serine peptidase, partial [Planctomycetes bacterium]|nr:S8 family serine peptidase [Planctomycetota bacterium]